MGCPAPLEKQSAEDEEEEIEMLLENYLQRCKVAGHFIQQCPTNGDPTYDTKRVRPPTGVPKSMLVSNPDGSYALAGGEVAVLRPNEAAFDREMEGVSSSSHSAGQLLHDLHC